MYVEPQLMRPAWNCFSTSSAPGKKPLRRSTPVERLNPVGAGSAACTAGRAMPANVANGMARGSSVRSFVISTQSTFRSRRLAPWMTGPPTLG
jgi:hypothetical protein